MPARNQRRRQTASGRSEPTALYGEPDQAAFFAAMIDAERLSSASGSEGSTAS
jgi:hypothetical protein